MKHTFSGSPLASSLVPAASEWRGDGGPRGVDFAVRRAPPPPAVFLVSAGARGAARPWALCLRVARAASAMPRPTLADAVSTVHFPISFLDGGGERRTPSTLAAMHDASRAARTRDEVAAFVARREADAARAAAAAPPRPTKAPSGGPPGDGQSPDPRFRVDELGRTVAVPPSLRAAFFKTGERKRAKKP
jgi:hypothetical protein